MPEILEAGEPFQPRSGRYQLLIIAVLLLVLSIIARSALSEWVDLLWFGSLGFSSVLWKSLALESTVFLVTSVTTFLLLFGAFRLLQRFHRDDLPSAHALVIGGRRISLPLLPALRVISVVASVLVALVTGLTLMSEWPTFALFWYAPRGASAVTDPIFSKPLDFFLFTLPAWHLIDSWLLTLAIATCAVALLFLIITSGSRSLETRRFSFASSPWRGLSLSLSPSCFFVIVGQLSTSAASKAPASTTTPSSTA